MREKCRLDIDGERETNAGGPGYCDRDGSQ